MLIDRFTAMARGDGPAAPVGKLIGFRPTSIEHGKAIFELEAGPQHGNPTGTLHGGIITDVADAAIGTAFASVSRRGRELHHARAQDQLPASVLERQAPRDRTRRESREDDRADGMRDVADAEGRLVARAMSTCMTIRGDLSEGR